MAKVDRHLRPSSQAFDDLQQRATRIGTVVENVKQIARQTNMLAIKAAIEAAWAGPARSSCWPGAQAQVGQMQQLSARSLAHSAAVHEVFTDIQSGAAQRVQTVAACSPTAPAGPGPVAGHGPARWRCSSAAISCCRRPRTQPTISEDAGGRQPESTTRFRPARLAA